VVLGRYRVLRRLGAGGMAEVFLAKAGGAEGLEKILVVKRVLPTFARSPRFIGMFVDEAKVAMRLNHPNIVQVYAFEQVREEFLLAMEYVDGLDLGRLLAAARRREQRLPYALCALIVMETAKGLDYAHNRKDESGTPMDIVHRDVSPQNVLVSYDGAVKIADFGIARARMVTEETGVIKGKFSYMSPEQARGQRVDRRSDVYSLGVLLAELLMNRAMYPGIAGVEVLEQVREGRVTHPRGVDRDVPEELDRIARRAMSLDLEERYPTCRSLAGALSHWLHEQDELHDAGELERFLLEVSPREVTSPEGPRRASNDAPANVTNATILSMGQGGRDLRERRGVVVVSGRLRDAREEGPVSGHETTTEGASDQAAGVLDDIAFKYDAILEWPDGRARRSFRFVLGLGRVSVDDPLHATRLSLDVLEALDGLSADAPVPISASIGLSRGTVSTVRSAGRIRHEPIGNVFDVARHLADAGAREEVLATGEVYRLARRAFSFDTHHARDVPVSTVSGPVPLAGVSVTGPSRSIRAYRLRGARTREERAADARALAKQVGLFGRSNEIHALVETYVETVQTQRSASLAIVGELGVGKSALVGAALGRFQPDPRLLRVECVFGTSEIPYAAVAELVREASGLQENQSEEETRALLRSTVHRLIKISDKRESVLHALEPLLLPSAKKSQEEGGDAHHLIAVAVRDLLAAIARKGPTVVWIDALQFADTPSLQLLARLLVQSYDSSLLVILCTRPGDRVEGILRGIPRIDLGELLDDDRKSLIVAHFGGAQVPPELHQAIVHRAGGNPFFLLELVEALLDRGVIRVEGEGDEKRVIRRQGVAFALPTTLEDVIAARITELPDAERLALRWLAVAGPGMREAEVSKISGGPLEDAISSLEARGLLVKKAGGVLGFSSAVVRHVAYESIDAGDRARMHRRVGSWLSGLDVTVPPARIARHHELAGDHAAAAASWKAAGKAALAVYSNRDALRFFARALQLLPEDSPDRFDLHEHREQILRILGMRSEQRIELEAMRAVAERTRQPRFLAVAMSRLARHDLDASRPAAVDAMLRRALDASIEAGDKSAEVEAMRLYGHLRRDQGDVHGALEAFDRALARAGLDPEQLGARGLTLVQKGLLLWRVGNLAASLEASAEAIAIFRRLGNKGHEAYALNALGVCLASNGSYEDAIASMRASIILDREAGDRMHLGRKTSNIGQMYADLGDVSRALEFLRRSLDIFESLEDHPGRPDALTAMGELLIEQVGDLDAATRALDDAYAIALRFGDPYDLAHERIVRGQLHDAMGDHASAERAAREAVSYARQAAAVGYELLASATRAKFLARLGRAQEARDVAHEAQGAARLRGVVERAERVHLELMIALELAGDPDGAARARADARSVVEAHLAQIRDAALRERYLATPTVRVIRGDAPSAQPSS
jgi:serine/threonine protein kinase/tetratricopeptide (TPR) repeat protein